MSSHTQLPLQKTSTYQKSRAEDLNTARIKLQSCKVIYIYTRQHLRDAREKSKGYNEPNPISTTTALLPRPYTLQKHITNTTLVTTPSNRAIHHSQTRAQPHGGSTRLV